MSVDLSLRAGITLAILIGALGLLVSQKLRTDLVALFVMLALIATQVLTPEEAFRALGRPLIVIVAGIFVVGAALRETGVVALISQGILRWTGSGQRTMLLVIMGTAALLSAILSSMLVVVIFMPVVLRVARERQIPAAQLLMPLATAAFLGNQLTLIGTPSNLVVSDLVAQHGEQALSFFALTPYALGSLLVGGAWYVWMGQRTLRKDTADAPQKPSLAEVERSYALDDHLVQLRVAAESELVGKQLAEAQLRSRCDVEVVAFARPHAHKLERAQPDTVLRPHDQLIVKGTQARIRQCADHHHLEWQGQVGLEDVGNTEETALHLWELLVSHRSTLAGKQIAEIDLRRRYGLELMAMNRQGEPMHEGLPNRKLKIGDILLVQGAPEAVGKVNDEEEFVLITNLEPDGDELVTSKAKVALAILAVMLLAVVLNWVSLAVALLSASLLVVVTGCLSLQQAYESVNAKIIIILAGMLPLATALQQTEAANFLANQIARVGELIGPYGALLLLYLGGSLMTQVAPNSVTAAIITPIALQLANAQEMSPQTFAIPMVFAATSSYITPLVSASNLLVKSKGNYTISDFLRNTLPIFALQTGVIFGLLIFWP